MEEARRAVNEFLAHAKGETTTVEETVAAPVTEAQIQRTRHEEARQVVDREVHKDHFHTTIQPLQHREVMPEKHTHEIAAVQERNFEHDDAEQTRLRLQREAAQFKDTTTILETQHTKGAAPVVEAEHVHHHVHEVVQPVIHKEIIEPHVHHVTVPVHEVHHATTEHHSASYLPPRTLSDFMRSGGVLQPGKTTHGEYQGSPRPYNSEMQHPESPIGLSHSTSIGSNGMHSGSPVSAKKPSLMNKLNPRTDADMDGKKGIMD